MLCHGKAMSAFEIDAYHDVPCMGAIQLPNLGDTVRYLPNGVSENLGVTKFVGAQALKHDMSAVPINNVGKLLPKTRGHVRPTTQELKWQVLFFFASELSSDETFKTT